VTQKILHRTNRRAWPRTRRKSRHAANP